VEVTGNLKEIYEDKDGQRREEVAALSGPNEFGEFYARLKQVSILWNSFCRYLHTDKT
jgi:splicing factor 3A subunit 3